MSLKAKVDPDDSIKYQKVYILPMYGDNCYVEVQINPHATSLTDRFYVRIPILEKNKTPMDIYAEYGRSNVEKHIVTDHSVLFCVIRNYRHLHNLMRVPINALLHWATHQDPFFSASSARIISSVYHLNHHGAYMDQNTLHLIKGQIKQRKGLAPDAPEPIVSDGMAGRMGASF